MGRGIRRLVLFGLSIICFSSMASKEVLISSTFPIDYKINGSDVYSPEMKQYISNYIKQISQQLEIYSANINLREDLDFILPGENRVKINLKNIKSMKGSVSLPDSSLCSFNYIDEVKDCLISFYQNK
ncbi:hypothetical protein N9N67_09735 [Bacteriovoracaceae bacterium]|nr:hypothetical protein [Bacteriovoracaceae bacterium]